MTVVSFQPGYSPKQVHLTFVFGSSASTRIRSGTGAPMKWNSPTLPTFGWSVLSDTQNPASPSFVVIAR